MNKNYYIYILTNQNNTTLYVGVTNNLDRRAYQHKNKMSKNSFSARYNLDKLIYFEETTNPTYAIEREKQLKKWSRTKKENLINTLNPDWLDLSDM